MLKPDTGAAWGYGYLAYSNVNVKNIEVLPDGIEILHSMIGASFKNNFFGGNQTGIVDGTVETIHFQYTAQIGALINHPSRFWGKAPTCRSAYSACITS